jgi:hypothetical protein
VVARLALFEQDIGDQEGGGGAGVVGRGCVGALQRARRQGQPLADLQIRRLDHANRPTRPTLNQWRKRRIRDVFMERSGERQPVFDLVPEVVFQLANLGPGLLGIEPEAMEYPLDASDHRVVGGEVRLGTGGERAEQAWPVAKPGLSAVPGAPPRGR